MLDNTTESRRLLRLAAELAVDDRLDRLERTAADGQPLDDVGTPGWLGRDRDRGWDQTQLLDVIEREYGRVIRWWLIAVREAVAFALIFWFVAFALGLLYGTEIDKFRILTADLSMGVLAVLLTALIRIGIGAGLMLWRERRQRRARTSVNPPGGWRWRWRGSGHGRPR